MSFSTYIEKTPKVLTNEKYTEVKDTDVNATDMSWLCSFSYTAMLRGPLHSEVELTLASIRNGFVYTIRVLRHRYHEFDSVECKSSPLVLSFAKGSGGKLPTSFTQQAAPERENGEREMKRERGGEREREQEIEIERERAVRLHKDAIAKSAERALSYASGTRYRMRHHPTALPASHIYMYIYTCHFMFMFFNFKMPTCVLFIINTSTLTNDMIIWF